MMVVRARSTRPCTVAELLRVELERRVLDRLSDEA
jgi:hypothetical protein